jgi:cysteine desulfurase/selenocysteine lyase
MDNYYRQTNANIHRGIHKLAEEATALYEASRQITAGFINAASSREIIFTRNTTEAINLVSQTWGRMNLKKGDTIILSEMEHHSNLVPWQMLSAEKELILEYIPITDEGFLNFDELTRMLDHNPRLVAITHMSNVLGTINPVKEIARLSHEAGALVLVDGAQSVPHFPVNVQDLGIDFLAFSGHKMCGPTGIGVLYGRKHLLEEMPPFLGGGDMIKRVTLEGFAPNEVPHKFEAGTPAIAEAIGLSAAIDYLKGITLEAIEEHEHILVTYALERLSEVPGITVYGPETDRRGGVTSFTMSGVHAHDVAQILDGDGIAVRAGHHCAMPLHEKLHITATTRASYYLYNSIDDVDKLIEGLYKVKKLFRL